MSPFTEGMYSVLERYLQGYPHSWRRSKIPVLSKVVHSKDVRSVAVRPSQPLSVNLHWNAVAGLGHGISNCPKQEEAQRRQIASHRVQDIGGY